MTTIQYANSIMELAFGVNLVGLALGQRFVVARESVIGAIRRRIAEVDPTFVIAPDDQALFKAFAANSSAAVRWASALRPIPQVLSATVVLASVLGLYVSAMKPDHPVAEPLVFWFATLSLVALPLMYAFYQRFLDWIVDRVAEKQLRDDSMAKKLASRFHMVRALVRIGDVGSAVVLAQYGVDHPIARWLTKRFVRRVAIEIGKGEKLDFLAARLKASKPGSTNDA